MENKIILLISDGFIILLSIYALDIHIRPTFGRVLSIDNE